MRMSERSSILEPEAEHTIHADVSQPGEGDSGEAQAQAQAGLVSAGRAVSLRNHPRRTQHQDPRRLGVHRIVQRGARARVGQIPDHAEIRQQQPPGKRPPRAPRLPVCVHRRPQDRRPLDPQERPRPRLDYPVVRRRRRGCRRRSHVGADGRVWSCRCRGPKTGIRVQERVRFFAHVSRCISYRRTVCASWREPNTCLGLVEGKLRPDETRRADSELK